MALFALVCAKGFAADWRDAISLASAGSFAPPSSLTARYDLGWTALTAGNVTVHFANAENAQVLATARAETTGWVRHLWKLNATVSSRIDARTLRPLEMTQVERYRDYTIRTHLRFANGEVWHLRSSTRNVEPAKWKVFWFANLNDLFSALLFVRSQRLAVGDKISLVVFPATSLYLAEVSVLGREDIVVSGRNYRALKLGIRLQKVTKKLGLEPHPKFKEATAWVSDDDRRLLLRIRAEVFVGSVWAELREAK